MLLIYARYVNMDFVFLNSMQQQDQNRCFAELLIVISYDITCQYFMNFSRHVMKYPPSLRLTQGSENLKVFVPKYHLNVYTINCWFKFSLNLSPFIGHTDGESLECGLAAINALAPSTKKRGPGSCQNTLDDHFGDQNWRKTTNMCTSNFHLPFPFFTSSCSLMPSCKTEAYNPGKS
jgi:hypothetical protein